MDNVNSQLETLKLGYIKLLTDKDILINWGKPQLEALYNIRIGVFKVQLLEQQLIIKSLKRKLEWVRSCINRQIKPDFAEIELILEAEMANAQAIIMAEAQKVSESKELLSNLSSPRETFELKKIYHSLAKNLHPDVNPDISDKQKEIWHLVLEAYRQGDTDKLKALSLVYEKDIKGNNSELTEADILLQIETLKQGSIILQEQINSIKSQFPFTIEDDIKNDQWVNEQVNAIETEITQLRQYETELNTEYTQLMTIYG